MIKFSFSIEPRVITSEEEQGGSRKKIKPMKSIIHLLKLESESWSDAEEMFLPGS